MMVTHLLTPPFEPCTDVFVHLATLDELDDPASTSARTPLTGRITSHQAQANTRSAGNAQGYLNSAIPGEDRRAPLNTLDESVWETLRRDLLAVWEKMRQVLYPKYLLGGMMNRGGNGMNEVHGEEVQGLMGGAAGAMGQIRGLVGRWPDADTVLQGGMSEGLRDWDLWFVYWCIREERISLTYVPGAHCSFVYYYLSCSASTPGMTNAHSSSVAYLPQYGLVKQL